ncbi:GH3 domain-containing protein isoform X2 [Amia ocellicauda]|uniref:GH3 domain-containing protein isoform X2 n=1 Tax=Amia ocellicauda TaxID=2972642 RepID=UPI003463BFB8
MLIPLLGLAGLLALGAAMLLLWRDVAWRAKGQRRSVGSLLSHYLAVKAAIWLGKRQCLRLETDAQHAKQAQEETLLKRLRKNANTHYGRLHDFSSMKDCAAFRERHPLTSYEDYRELVSRVASGEEGVLTAERPSILALTSGTSGSSSMLLSTRDTSSEFFLQERWQELVEDVERGRVNPGLDIEEVVRHSLDAWLRPDRHRAAQLRAQLEQGFQGIARRLWPRLNLVLAVDSGSNQVYGERLREYYCQGVSFYSPFYAATEGLIGVNLWPEREPRQYLLCPRSMLCEFIPEGSLEEEHPATLLMDQVKVGECYELAVTNAAGLYRYRIGDVVKVVEFHKQCPIVEFQYRRGQMLNVRGEKVTEQLFYGALRRAVALWPGAQLVDYCCAESGILGPSSGGSDPHYQVFLELKGVRNLTEEQRYKLDHCLQEDSAVYKSFRLKGSIGPMRVQLVGGGAFRDLRARMLSSSHVSPNTLKMHRVLRQRELVGFIQGKIIS